MACDSTYNLFNALVDKDNIVYRYVVDTFGMGITAESKNQLSNLAKTRQNAFAIINAPSIADYKKSIDPSFVDLKGAVNTHFIAQGGDLTKNPQNVYSLPSLGKTLLSTRIIMTILSVDQHIMPRCVSRYCLRIKSIIRP